MEIGDSAEGTGPKRDPTRGGTGGTQGLGPGECDDEANMPAVGTYSTYSALILSLLLTVRSVLLRCVMDDKSHNATSYLSLCLILSSFLTPPLHFPFSLPTPF